MTVSYPISYPVSYPISYPVGNANLGGASVPPWVQPGAIIDELFTTGQYYPRAIAQELVDTRASTKFVTDTTGLLTSVAVNALPISNAGLLIERSAANLTLSSGDFTNSTYWTMAGGTLTGGQADPAGGTAGVLFNEGTATSAHNIVSAAGGNINYTLGTTYVGSIYAKAGTKSIFQMTVAATAFSGVGYANFDLAAGTVAATGGALVGSGIQNLGNGLFRCWIAVTATATVAASSLAAVVGILSTASTRAPSYTGASGTLTFAFPQTEVGTFPTSYFPTTTATATRAADSAAIQRTGIGRIVFTFDDNSQQTVSGINTAAQYTIPANLNRPLIKRMTGYAA